MPLLPREILEWTEKDPADLLDYALDFEPQFGPDDDLAAASWSMPTDLTFHQQANSGNLALVWFSGGAQRSPVFGGMRGHERGGPARTAGGVLPVRKHKAL